MKIHLVTCLEEKEIKQTNGRTTLIDEIVQYCTPSLLPFLSDSFHDTHVLPFAYTAFSLSFFGPIIYTERFALIRLKKKVCRPMRLLTINFLITHPSVTKKPRTVELSRLFHSNNVAPTGRRKVQTWSKTRELNRDDPVANKNQTKTSVVILKMSHFTTVERQILLAARLISF